MCADFEEKIKKKGGEESEPHEDTSSSLPSNLRSEPLSINQELISFGVDYYLDRLTFRGSNEAQQDLRERFRVKLIDELYERYERYKPLTNGFQSLRVNFDRGNFIHIFEDLKIDPYSVKSPIYFNNTASLTIIFTNHGKITAHLGDDITVINESLFDLKELTDFTLNNAQTIYLKGVYAHKSPNNTFGLSYITEDSCAIYYLPDGGWIIAELKDLKEGREPDFNPYFTRENIHHVNISRGLSNYKFIDNPHIDSDFSFSKVHIYSVRLKPEIKEILDVKNFDALKKLILDANVENCLKRECFNNSQDIIQAFNQHNLKEEFYSGQTQLSKILFQILENNPEILREHKIFAQSDETRFKEALIANCGGFSGNIPAIKINENENGQFDLLLEAEYLMFDEFTLIKIDGNETLISPNDLLIRQLESDEYRYTVLHRNRISNLEILS